jgi:hypothetical protein
MPALVAGIHVFTTLQRNEDVDGRDEPGHDEPRGLAPKSPESALVDAHHSIAAAYMVQGFCSLVG